MAWTPTRIYGPAQPGTTNATLYTASGNVVVKEILLSNTSASAATVTLAINAAATTAANQIVPALSVPANSIIILAVSIPLVNTDTIQGLQGTSAAVTVTISAEVQS